MTLNDITADAHRPTADFRDFLEHEVTRAVRHGRFMRRMRLAAVVVASISIGTTAGLASAQIRQGSQRDSLLEAAQADAALANVRLNLVRMQLQEEQKQVAIGSRSPESLAAAEAQVKEIEAQVGRLDLNMREISASGLAPRDELNAPLVNGRDFMKERLQVDLQVAQQELTRAEQALEQTNRKVSVGAVSEIAGTEAELNVARARAKMVVLAQRMSLREEFLEKATPIKELAARLDRVSVEQDLVVAQRALEVATERTSLLQKQFAVGAAGQLDVLKARVDLTERQMEVQHLAARLRDLKRPTP
jgi:hypothetical protein